MIIAVIPHMHDSKCGSTGWQLSSMYSELESKDTCKIGEFARPPAKFGARLRR